MRFFLVDNDPVFLKLVEKLLKSDDHEVLTATDGLSALDILKNHTPDFIFIDYVMPNIDGGVLCRIVKNTPRLADCFVVLLSAVAAEEWADCGYCGADAYIAKTPFNQIKKDILEVVKDREKARRYCERGRVIGLDAISPRVITRELLTSKKHYNSLLNKMSEGILELNAKDRIVYANPSALSIFDKPERDILGLSVFDLFSGERETFIENLLSGENKSRDEFAEDRILFHKDKHLAFKTATLEGLDRHRLVIVEDITTLKQVEISLRETNNFLKSIFDSSRSFSIISTDLDQNIVFWNKGAENMFGYRADEVVGKEKISILYPGIGDEEIAALMREAVKGEKSTLSFETREIAKSGEELWVKVHLSSRVDKNGRVVGVLGIGENITDIKNMEEEKEELQNQLLQSRKLESIGTLAGGVAHDFNNLLMGIQGHISLAMLKSGNNKPVDDNLRAIEDFVRKGANLTNKLLNLSKGVNFAVAPGDLNDVLKKAVDTFGKKRKNIDVKTDLSGDLWKVDLNQEQMEQVFTNMFENAADAMQGRGRIGIGTRNLELKDQQARPHSLGAGKYVEVSIEDDGVGMDKETLEKIFDPFFTTRKRASERGAGLGLAVVYRTIKSHRGMIKVHSQPGQGSVFKIYLPASRKAPVENAAVPEEASETTETASGDEVVLIVDDEQITLEVFSRMIQKLGYRTFQADNAEKAFEIFGGHHDEIDLVILDMVMPDMDVETIFLELKRIDPDCRVLLSSGYNRDVDSERVMDLGCAGFIQKPFNMEKLSETIRSVLDK